MTNEQLTLPGHERTTPKRRRRPPTLNGGELKRRGMSAALDNSRAAWKMKALKAVLAVADTLVFFSMNHIRDQADRMEIGEPHHPNAWGAVIGAAKKLGIMVDTGEHERGRRPSMRHRKIPVYKRTDLDEGNPQ